MTAPAVTENILTVVEDVEFMIATGCTHPEVITARIGLGHKTISTYLHRAGRQDLALYLNRRAS